MTKVMIVDDDRALTVALSVRLSAEGFDVRTSHSAHDAVARVLHERPDVILLDVDMPSYTGPEFHQFLQLTERARGIPVVYMTGHDTEGNRRTAIEQGAATFLTKPFEIPHLLSVLREAARRSSCRGVGGLSATDVLTAG